ncbi:MAG: hypothetical protein IPH20_10730 [Bacteroidales bacterium]|nr:hypothetical protein [Bacteroidales bacterium]
MRCILIFAIFIAAMPGAFAQTTDSITNTYLNGAEKLLTSDGRLVIGGYGEVHYNQPLSSKTMSNGTLDVHRMVLLLGYNFSPKTQFISEIEYEHVSEVYIESFSSAQIK